MEKRLQKSSPFSPLEGRSVSSVFPRRIGRGFPVENVTPGDELTVPEAEDAAEEGRMKAGVMGVIEGCNGCGAAAGEAWAGAAANGARGGAPAGLRTLRAPGAPAWPLRAAMGAAYPG